VLTFQVSRVVKGAIGIGLLLAVVVAGLGLAVLRTRRRSSPRWLVFSDKL